MGKIVDKEIWAGMKVNWLGLNKDKTDLMLTGGRRQTEKKK